jgi:hypothetical protein
VTRYLAAKVNSRRHTWQFAAPDGRWTSDVWRATQYPTSRGAKAETRRRRRRASPGTRRENRHMVQALEASLRWVPGSEVYE